MDPTTGKSASSDSQASETKMVDEKVERAEPDYLRREITYEEEPDTVYRMGFTTFVVLTSLALTNAGAGFLAATGTTIAYQVQDVGGANVISWIPNASTLPILALGPMFGYLSDRIGKKWLIVGGNAIGVVGTSVSGSAQTIGQLIAGQVVTGLGSAMASCCIPAINEVVPNKYRSFAYAYSMALAGLLALAGVFSAGAYAQARNWRWAYYQGSILCGVSFLVTLAFYWPPPTGLRRRGLLNSIIKEIDYLSTFIIAVSMTLVVLALTWGGTTYPWSSAPVVAPLVIGCVGFVALGLWAWKGTKYGLFDHRLFRNRNFPILMIVNAMDGIILGLNIELAQVVRDLFTGNALTVATYLTPIYVILPLMVGPVGFIMGKTQTYRRMLVLALAWMSIWLGLLSLLTPQRRSLLLAGEAMISLAVAVTNVIPVVALTLSVPSMLLGAAGTLANVFRLFGFLIVVTIMSAIYNNRMAEVLPAKVAAAVLQTSPTNAPLIGEIIGIVYSLGKQTSEVLHQIMPQMSPALIDSIQSAVTEANTISWKHAWVAMASLMAATAVLACFLKPVKDHMNNHIESAVEKSEVRDHQMQGKVM